MSHAEMDVATSLNIRAAHSFSAADAENLLVDYVSLGALLDERSRKTPTKIFLRFFDDDADVTQEFSYQQFSDTVTALTDELVNRYHIQCGDTVGILASNHPLAAIALFACWQIGAVAAPQNLHENDERMAFMLDDADCKLLLALPDCMDKVHAVKRFLPVQRLLSIITLSVPIECQQQQEISTREWEDFRHDPALIVYTSGTTGNPKGVVLTQYNLMINALGTSIVHGIDAETRMMCVLPIHHVNGILVTLITPLYAGSSVVLNRSFKPRKFWPRIAEQKVAIVSVVPTLLQFLCEADGDISTLDLSVLRHIICGAGTLAVALLRRFEKRFSVPILHGYGLSETTAFVCSISRELPQTAHQWWGFEHGYPSIGVAYPHVEIAIHDAEGQAQLHGVRGEIVVRGHYVMSGYHHRPDANADTFKHGWFRSGDEGFFETDDNGRAFYFITGRLKELINRGGVKYSPFEIEEILLQLSGVKVGLAIAFDNDWYGEEVGAYVVCVAGAALTASQILSHCRQHLSFSQCPKVVVFGEEVPVTITGKYQRLKLKQLFAQYQHIQFRDTKLPNI
jgi:long-chain acyl-CoA synthetase